MPFEDYDIIMYPPSQSFMPYQDSSLSEEAFIHGEDEAFLEKASPSTPPQTTRTWRHNCSTSTSISILISIITTASLCLLLLLIPTRGHPFQKFPLYTASPSPPPPKHLHCGTTPSQARSQNCTFDIMSFAWTPEPCSSPTLSHTFLSTNGPWTFYEDHNATVPIPMDKVQEYEVVWTEHHYHVVHCLYAWERLHRAALARERVLGGGVLVPGEMGNLNHTMHCVGLLGEGSMVERRKVNAVAYLVFDGCVVL